MLMMRWWILIWLFIEITLFIKVGQLIGVLGTLFLIVLGMFVGGLLVRLQGFRILFNLRHQIQSSGLAPEVFIDSISLTLCGFLLMIPGFLTDFIALIMLLPFLRKKLINKLLTLSSFRTYSSGSRQKDFYDTDEHHNQIIEGELYEKRNDQEKLKGRDD